MASNRDPQKDYRINRRGRKVTSSADRSKRAKKASAPKPTSSSTRSRGSGTGSKKVTSASDRVAKKPVSGSSRGAQGPRTAPQQGPSKPVKGLIGSRGSAPRKGPPTVKTPSISKVSKQLSAPKPTAGMKTSSSNLRARGTAALAGAIATGSLLNPVTRAKKKESDKRKAKAAKSAGKYNTKDKDGTVRSRAKVGPKKVGPKKVGPKKVGTIAQSFDNAFAAARKAGKSEFTFKGKKYSTKTT